MTTKSTVMIVTLLAALSAGCYESANHGDEVYDGQTHDPALDPGADPAVDPAADPYHDWWIDPAMDPAVDPAYDPRIDPSIDLLPDPAVDPWMDPPMWCQAKGGAMVEFDVSGSPMADPMGRRCTVQSMAPGDPGGFLISLGCPESSGLVALYFITVSTNPPVSSLLLSEGMTVQFSYIVDQPWWTNRWFTIIGAEGYLLAAGVDAIELVPYGVDPETYYYPLRVDGYGGWCPWTPSDCGDEERVALGVGTGGSDPITVFDANEGTLNDPTGRYQVIVDTAVVYHNVHCDDFAEQWFRALIVRGY